ncbi:asparaginase [Xylanibacillus composti]|uniref:Asparaginase n=1 Tax=Xylanibacillus composti TaxID=1572762 RepID=A0A8J4H0K3_9BACL|nr:asparaginase [Xylanibacillus composti]
MTASLGDSRRETFIRSSAKPLQAAAVLISGAADRYGLSAAEVSLICASHSGEPEHVQAAKSLMERLGLEEHHLHCGTHEPYAKAAREALRAAGQPPTVLHHNCSGKHLGMLAMAKALSVPLDGYWLPEHPVQQRMLAAVSELSGVPADLLTTATDGCGVPTYRMPLEQLARAYLAWCAPQSAADTPLAASCRTIYDSIVRHPFYLAGSGRFDTKLAEITSGRWIAKMGADGVLAMASREAGFAVALKCDDGSLQAVYAAGVEVLLQLEELSSSQAAALAAFHKPKLYNQAGLAIGRIEPDISLRRS